MKSSSITVTTGHFLLFTVLILTFVTCTSPLDYEDSVRKALTKEMPLEFWEKCEKIVLIPGSGCSGCITDAENYFVRHVQDSDTWFIFTNVLSVKELKIRVGAEKLKAPNVYLDLENKFYFASYANAIYPCVIYVKENVPGRFANLDELL